MNLSALDPVLEQNLETKVGLALTVEVHTIQLTGLPVMRKCELPVLRM